MKKNVMMRVAAMLLVCVLASTCGISGTFAKYVTQGTGTDSARVAKFGVVITHNNQMFSDSYKDGKTTWIVPESGDTITVQASTEGQKVVAPGTNGTLSNFAVTGTPEVDVEVTYTANLELTGWNIGGAVYYCPLVINVNGHKIYGMDYANENAFEEAVEAAIVYYGHATYDTNTDLSTVNDDLVVTWSWAFEGTDGKQTDEYDTKLGDQAAGLNGGVAANIELTVTCIITQVD